MGSFGSLHSESRMVHRTVQHTKTFCLHLFEKFVNEYTATPIQYEMIYSATV